MHVPDNLLDHFGEMSPIFCNAEIPFEAVGEYTQNNARKLQVSENPRRLLVGGVRARTILLATPLLKVYMEHGLVISRVYQVVEFTPNPCFADFTEEVGDARRRADSDPRFEIFADTMKLIRNSAYGSMIMNKEKHPNVTYCATKEKAGYFAFKKSFRTLNELENNYFEVELAKTRIKLYLPIHIGYFVLQYAKLRMLEFYYDCVDKFCNRKDFQLMAMDTDSLYMALSADCLTDIIKSDMQSLFEKEKHQWFPR